MSYKSETIQAILTEVTNAKRVRVWLLSALLNRALGGSSDSMLTRLREALQTYYKPHGDFPIAALDEAISAAGRIAASSDDAVENVLNTTYGDDTCFLALSLLYVRGIGERCNTRSIIYSRRMNSRKETCRIT
jgi:hypothetical protein